MRGRYRVEPFERERRSMRPRCNPDDAAVEIVLMQKCVSLFLEKTSETPSNVPEANQREVNAHCSVVV
jgi:hypothetical protein